MVQEILDKEKKGLDIFLTEAGAVAFGLGFYSKGIRGSSKANKQILSDYSAWKYRTAAFFPIDYLAGSSIFP